MEKIAQGAEAILYRDGKRLVKRRVKKSYRLPQIDEKLRKRRTKKEASLLSNARRAGVATPRILDVQENEITMEFLAGARLKDFLNKDNFPALAEKIGKSVALLHEFDMIHGDLTTSNMIFLNEEIFFIDFGLGFVSKKTEDKAVDLHLLYQALVSTHYAFAESMMEIILKAYEEKYVKSSDVLKTLERIEKRGRYKVRECQKTGQSMTRMK